MSEVESIIIEKLRDTLPVIPDSKKEYFLGYAEGVADMVKKQEGENGTEDVCQSTGDHEY